MMFEINTLAELLGVQGGALLKLAGDVAHNAALRTVADLTEGQRLELYLFLQAAAIAEGKITLKRTMAA